MRRITLKMVQETKLERFRIWAMILRRKNLRNKSPKSKVLQNVHVPTKKYLNKTKHSKKQKKSIDNVTHLSQLNKHNETSSRSDSSFQESVRLTRSSTSSGSIFKSKEASKNSASSKGGFHSSSVDDGDLSCRKIRLRSSVNVSEFASKLRKKNENLPEKSRTKISSQHLAAKRKKAKPYDKAKHSQKTTIQSQNSEKNKSCRNKRNFFKKAVDSTSCLDGMYFRSVPIDDFFITDCRARLRSSSSSRRSILIEEENNEKYHQSASAKVSKMKLANKKLVSPKKPSKVKSTQKNGLKKIENFKDKKKRIQVTNDSSDKLSANNKKSSILPSVFAEMDDLILNTSILYESEDSSYELRKKSKKDLQLQARRSTRVSKRLSPSDVKDDSTMNLNNLGRKRKESAKCYTKKTEKIKVNNKKTVNATGHQGSVKENVKQTRLTVSSRKITDINSFSSPLSATVLSKSLPNKFCYRLNSIPVDDLTVTALSTPPTIERLFASNLAKRPSVSSTPLLIKKSSSRVDIVRKSLPGKGSLKRKRWVMNSLKGLNEGYEDDLFENREIQVPSLLDDSDMSDISIATPKCAYLVSPNLPVKTPHFKDCYSPTQLFNSRKVAEEYMHRRNKNRKKNSTGEVAVSAGKKTSPSKNNINVSSEAKRSKLLELVDTLNMRQNSIELNEDNEEDDYFNDISF
ncbi:micronuclear linker histone polyprotein [Parasteatoda tepidariorum]|uniref:micronuclear linker histone polyprotein n=1 Tax=Parasteatoda tepidariorum TaxID=114398 RepID=UPI001C71D3A0|nr:uncharacterized protein LOC107454749 [Parasteatoda tepidariorum]